MYVTAAIQTSATKRIRTRMFKPMSVIIISIILASFTSSMFHHRSFALTKNINFIQDMRRIVFLRVRDCYATEQTM